MVIQSLKLSNFRNYTKKAFDFEEKTVVVGPNGSGKSNLAEAIYLLATGKSYKADKEEEMIAYGEKLSIVGSEIQMSNDKYTSQSQNSKLKIILSDGSLGITRKKFEVNGVAKRMIDFVGIFKAVMFGPQDMELVTGNPSGRRRYLDFVISQMDREYRRDLISYEKGVRQRNRLLERIREGEATRSQLFFWDKLLIKNGEYITWKREEYLEKLNNFKVAQFTSIYDKSVISESRLKQYELEEVAAGVTLVGPHRDDFVTEMNKKDVSKFGSRGEQRMAVLWLKEGELAYLTRDGELPVLLLDDIFSELDHKNRLEIEREIEDLIKRGGQVMITTADEHMMPKDGWNIIKLNSDD
jgi:DNA replication and repair protein RecF